MNTVKDIIQDLVLESSIVDIIFDYKDDMEKIPIRNIMKKSLDIISNITYFLWDDDQYPQTCSSRKSPHINNGKFVDVYYNRDDKRLSIQNAKDWSWTYFQYN